MSEQNFLQVKRLTIDIKIPKVKNNIKTNNLQYSVHLEKHCSYYSAEFIFPDFSGHNESFSLTNLFTRNANVGFQCLQSH